MKAHPESTSAPERTLPLSAVTSQRKSKIQESLRLDGAYDNGDRTMMILHDTPRCATYITRKHMEHGMARSKSQAHVGSDTDTHRVIRTYDHKVESLALCRLSYAGLCERMSTPRRWYRRGHCTFHLLTLLHMHPEEPTKCSQSRQQHLHFRRHVMWHVANGERMAGSGTTNRARQRW